MKYFPIESPVFGHHSHHQLDEHFIIKIESEVIIDCTESVLTDSVSVNDDIRATMSLCQTGDENQFNCLIDNSSSNDDNHSKADENDIIDYNDNDDIDIKPLIGESSVGRRCSSPTTHSAFMRRTSSFESSGYVGSSYTSSETASIKSDTGSSCEKSETESICTTNGTNGASSKDSSNGVADTPYFCKWTNCDWPGNKDDLVDHIREIHVELQPYQQQKHNWEIKTNAAAIDRKICADSSSNNKLVNSKKFGDSSNNIGSQSKKSESQQYVCLWEGCKVYGKSSLSRNWLERHALLHSGPRPFKCIVEGCDARFKTQSALERHVNSHFKPNVADLSCSNSTNNLFEPSTSTTANGILTPSNCSISDNSNHCSNGNGMSPFELHLQQSSHATMIRVSNQLMNGSHANANPSFNHSNATPNKILKRKKSQTKLKRKCIIVKCSEDFFDECVMEQVRYGLIQLNAQTGLDMSTQTAITFHSKVIARRKNEKSGEINVLLKWEPNDILPDVWVTEPEVSSLKSKSIPISLLPQECLAQLTELSGGGEEIKPKIKQRRK